MSTVCRDTKPDPNYKPVAEPDRQSYPEPVPEPEAWNTKKSMCEWGWYMMEPGFQDYFMIVQLISGLALSSINTSDYFNVIFQPCTPLTPAQRRLTSLQMF